MQDYSVALTNTNAVAFPDTEAINATGPSTTDGTEFVKAMIDDFWGRNQAIMNHAGLIPDGVTEADGTAQIIEALHKGFGAAPGIIQEWNIAADPGTTGHRALLIQGQGILHASYPDLLAAVYVGDGNNAAVAAAGGAYYKADDAAGTTPNVAGIYLILPEGRGVTTRGLDVAAAIDPDGASRYVGDLQSDLSGPHNHTSGYPVVSGADAAFKPFGLSAEVSQGQYLTGAAAAAEYPLTSTSTGAETRMYNRSTKFVIWY